jgi:hypothetical protein
MQQVTAYSLNIHKYRNFLLETKAIFTSDVGPLSNRAPLDTGYDPSLHYTETAHIIKLYVNFKVFFRIFS